MSSTDDNKEREAFQKAIDNTETDFEKNLTYISAGALGLSITFIDKIVKIDEAEYFGFLLFGWGFLILTLGLNLISHLISKYFIVKTRDEYDNNLHDNDKIKSRNKILDTINWVTVISLILGIIFIVTFSAKNMTKSKEDKSKQQTETTKKEQFGRTVPVPDPKKNDTSKKK